MANESINNSSANNSANGSSKSSSSAAAAKAAKAKAAAAAKAAAEVAAQIAMFNAMQQKQKKQSNEALAKHLLANNASAEEIIAAFNKVYAGKKVTKQFIAQRAFTYMKIAMRDAAKVK